MKITKWTPFTFLMFAILSIALVSSCTKSDDGDGGSGTTGCNDQEANNAGVFDNDCDNCCTYDKDKFLGEYFGGFDCVLFSQLDSDSVTFEITEGFFNSADSVNVQIFADALVIPTPSRISNDSIYISTYVEDYMVDIGGTMFTTDLEVTGTGVIVESTNTLTADLHLQTVGGLPLPQMDDCVFIGVKQ